VILSIRGSRGPRASGNRIRMYAGPVTWAIITIGCEFRFVNTNNLLVSAIAESRKLSQRVINSHVCVSVLW